MKFQRAVKRCDRSDVCGSVHSTVRGADRQAISTGNQSNNEKGCPAGENASSVACCDQEENRLVEMIRKRNKAAQVVKCDVV